MRRDGRPHAGITRWGWVALGCMVLVCAALVGSSLYVLLRAVTPPSHGVAVPGSNAVATQTAASETATGAAGGTATTSSVVNGSSSGAGPYRVSGQQILDGSGRPFIPYGVEIDGVFLSQANWQTDGVLAHDTFDQMQAARDFWHSNTVDLKLGSTALFAQSPYDIAYIAKVDQDVMWAHQLGMNIILVYQTEGFGNSRTLMPTQSAIAFWNVMAARYAQDSWVFFDLFNEPDPSKLIGTWDNDATWSFWQYGGTVNGTTYIGFQQLVDTVRGLGATNLVLADGAAAGEDIALLPHHMLNGKNIVYAIHPYFSSAQHANPLQWDQWFGTAAKSGLFPVVADEWAEYQSPRGECVANAAQLVPQFLDYLRSLHIGVIGYALVPGVLIRGWNYRNPTAFDQATYTCEDTSGAALNAVAQGTGQLLAQYFATYGAN